MYIVLFFKNLWYIFNKIRIIYMSTTNKQMNKERKKQTRT